MAGEAWQLGALAERVGAELVGDADYEVTGLATLASAGPADLSFLANSHYGHQLATTGAGAVIVRPEQRAECPTHALISENPYFAYAQVSHLFDGRPLPRAGVHRSASVDPEARVAETASIGPQAVVEAGAAIGEGAEIGPGSVVGADSVVGPNCRLAANVTIYHGVVLGDSVVVHSGAVIGSDGFGFAPEGGRWYKIAQIGGVRIGDNVEIGASTTIDRGALDDTQLGNGVIVDNLVQIAHNVVIGDYTALAGCVGVSGSTRIGRNCLIGGGVGLAGHLEIADGVHVTGMTLVSRSINRPGAYSSGTALEETSQWRKNAARFRQLDRLSRRVRELEQQMKPQDEQGNG